MLLEWWWCCDRRCRRRNCWYKLIQRRPEGNLWRNSCSSMSVCRHYFENCWFSLAILGHFHGSVFVTIHARRFLEGLSCQTRPIISLVNLCLVHLSDSAFLDDLDHIATCFDKTTKLRFRNSEEPQYVKFGSTKDNDKSYNIRFGQLKLMGRVLFIWLDWMCLILVFLGLMLPNSFNHL